MMLIRLCAVVLLAAGVAACGQVPGSGAGSARAGSGSAAPPVTVVATGPAPGARSAQPRPRPSRLKGPVTLTAADGGAVVSLRVGQSVVVVLAPDFEAWHQPAAAGAVLRRVSASGGYPGREPARAVFLAVAPGTARLTGISDTACLHASPPCMVPQRTWQVTVTVRGS